MTRQGKQYNIVKTYALAWRAKAAAKRLGLQWTANGNGYAVIRPVSNPNKHYQPAILAVKRGVACQNGSL